MKKTSDLKSGDRYTHHFKVGGSITVTVSRVVPIGFGLVEVHATRNGKPISFFKVGSEAC